MSKFYDHQDNDVSDTDNVLNERIQFMSENFALEDFLEFNPTRDFLEQNFVWEFEKKCEEPLERFYKGEVDYCRADLSTLFNNEINYEHRGIFQAIVFNHIKPKYDLDPLYCDASLCNIFLARYEDQLHLQEQERLKKQRENYKKNTTGKTFDWSTKTYK